VDYVEKITGVKYGEKRNHAVKNVDYTPLIYDEDRYVSEAIFKAVGTKIHARSGCRLDEIRLPYLELVDKKRLVDDDCEYPTDHTYELTILNRHAYLEVIREYDIKILCINNSKFFEGDKLDENELYDAITNFRIPFREGERDMLKKISDGLINASFDQAKIEANKLGLEITGDVDLYTDALIHLMDNSDFYTKSAFIKLAGFNETEYPLYSGGNYFSPYGAVVAVSNSQYILRMLLNTPGDLGSSQVSSLKRIMDYMDKYKVADPKIK